MENRIMMVLLAFVTGLARQSIANDSAPAPESRPTSHTFQTAFDTAKHDSPILLPVRFHGKEYSFIADTGSSLNVFDESFRPLLGKPIRKQRVRTSEGLLSVELFESPEAYVGPFSLKSGVLVFCSNFETLRQTIGIDVYGIVGMAFLRNYIVEVDFDEGLILMKEPVDRARASLGRGIPITYKDLWIPTIHASLPSGTAQFMIDTGNMYTGTLEKGLFDRLSKTGVLTKMKQATVVLTPGGAKEVPQGRLAELRLGDFRHNDLVFTAGMHSDLGLAYLSRYKLVLDFPGKQVYLTRGKRYSDSDPLIQQSGLALRRVNNDTIVIDVATGSPADIAGIRVDDVIVSILDRPAKEYRLVDIRRLVRSRMDAGITFRIRRDGKEFDRIVRSAEGSRK